ncbi:alpha/beta hydrolase domain-containing protein WAV2 isoform X5 [Manihot esculenta]|uniref:alpha/beta hydrolase domain-containing protein WAV2 isoform X5 n=1 Tax=Manihot esculenta TaxID=3983 RepID=UPI001CC742C3|nr:alpha/beta hydrolase domain-containing protein WAV2 isoform X5 [Manihot esculenta]
MVSYVSALLYGVGGIVVAGMALLVAFQERLVYVPVLPGLTKSYPITPARLRLTYEDVWLRSSDGVRLHAWFIKLFPECRGPTILFFQENAGNIAHRLEMIRIMIQRLQCNVFMLSYRGYGASDGYPSQQGITKDSQAALDHLSQRTDIDTSRIVVFGRSLGGAVGALLTTNNPDKIRQPILFLSGLQDEMVPPSHMALLYAKAAAHNKECIFVEFPTGMHMDTWLAGGDHYWRTIQQFLEKHVSEKKEHESYNTDQGIPFASENLLKPSLGKGIENGI